MSLAVVNLLLDNAHIPTMLQLVLPDILMDDQPSPSPTSVISGWAVCQSSLSSMQGCRSGGSVPAREAPVDPPEPKWDDRDDLEIDENRSEGSHQSEGTHHMLPPPCNAIVAMPLVAIDQIGMQCNDEHRRKGHRAVPAGVCPISPEIVEVANTSNCIQMGELSRLPQSPTATSTAPPP